MEILWLRFNTDQSFTIVGEDQNLFDKTDALGQDKTSFFSIESKTKALIWLQEFLGKNPHLILVDSLWQKIDIDELHEIKDHLFVIENHLDTKTLHLLISLLVMAKIGG